MAGGSGGGSEEEADDGVYCICRTSDTSRFMIGCDNCNEWYHGDCISITEEFAKNVSKFFCLLCRTGDPSLKTIFKSDKKSCGQCNACVRSQDCGKCETCLDGGGRKCRRRVCKVERKRKEEKREKRRREEEEHLRAEQEARERRKKEKERRRKEKELQLKREAEERERRERELEEQRELEREREALEKENHRAQQQQAATQRKAAQKAADRYLQDDEYVPEGGGRSTAKRGNARKQQKQQEYQVAPRRLRRRGGDDEFLWNDRNRLTQEEAKQCFGPKCAQVARANSKYCSDECGMKLAMSRIFEILPARIQSWQMRTAEAELSNERELQKIREQIREADFEELEYRRKKTDLEKLIRRAKSTPITEEDIEESEDQEQIYCVTCGHEFQTRTAIRHMERCFNRYESQTSYGSAYPTKGDLAEMFCEFHVPSQQSYCKRLKILCPEHYKEPKVLDTEVCGFPIQKELFNESDVDFCRLPKKKCIKHISWERMKRAQVDMEIIRARLKREDLSEQERTIQIQMVSRGGVLGLMLHDTIEHEDKMVVEPQDSNARRSLNLGRMEPHKALLNHPRFKEIREGPGSPSGAYRGDHDYGFRPT
ncbi:PHD finger and CXXC domain-containing protein-like [Tropilaelaps mercedesae]|uniref:CXXC-type zinc finger protein 1 n=1 Tax=Tropilaelaps mercedesae TaxID=418985 RepID=A0A1V9X748_9ACAR|nr:PHD finger and CXXC domain-containing protein-like [Tropilaelaps mercedesae]